MSRAYAHLDSAAEATSLDLGSSRRNAGSGRGAETGILPTVPSMLGAHPPRRPEDRHDGGGGFKRLPVHSLANPSTWQNGGVKPFDHTSAPNVAKRIAQQQVAARLASPKHIRAPHSPSVKSPSNPFEGHRGEAAHEKPFVAYTGASPPSMAHPAAAGAAKVQDASASGSPHRMLRSTKSYLQFGGGGRPTGSPIVNVAATKPATGGGGAVTVPALKLRGPGYLTPTRPTSGAGSLSARGAGSGGRGGGGGGKAAMGADGGASGAFTARAAVSGTGGGGSGSAVDTTSAAAVLARETGRPVVLTPDRGTRGELPAPLSANHGSPPGGPVAVAVAAGVKPLVPTMSAKPQYDSLFGTNRPGKFTDGYIDMHAMRGKPEDMPVAGHATNVNVPRRTAIW